MTGKKSRNQIKRQSIKHKFKAKNLKLLALSFGFALYVLSFKFVGYAEEEENKQAAQPIIVNGDTVEYVTDNKEFTATGNVVVIYKDTRLTCEKLSLNSETKDCRAEGNVRLDNADGALEGAKIIYNFESKKGVIIDANFRSNPYFGRTPKLNKVSDAEFISYRGYMSTCSFDNPHWRVKARRVNFFPGDKVQLKDSLFYLGKVPLLYLPQYNHSLKDPFMRVQVMPGKKSDWGPYLLTAWRYNLTEDVKGRIYLDYRQKLGNAQGFGVNYNSPQFGKGDFKYYYTQERMSEQEEGEPAEFQRYLIRLRHKWDIDEKTDLVAEYYKITDSKREVLGTEYNLLKDYFPREYEKDSQPLSYVLIHRSFEHSSADFLLQKRTNRWYAQEEKLPQINYSLPSLELGDSPFYFEHSSSYVNYNYKEAVPSPSEDDITYNEFSTTNKLSLPTRAAFINLTPFFSSTETFNDNAKGVYHRTLEINFTTGADMSTKFYRIFNVKSNFLGLDINDLRHIITPLIGYSYATDSTMPSTKFRYGGGATIGSSSVTLELSNKLQTKRKGQRVDLARFQVNSAYDIKPKTADKRGSNLSDFLFKLDLYPYSWLSLVGDATYERSVSRSEENYNHFSNANYDINFNFAEGRTFSLGQRYNRKGSKGTTYQLRWKLNPKWKFSVYQYLEHGNLPDLVKGLRVQEYTVSRDLHCWEMDVTYNVTRTKGESIWFIFRLKAFPELEFDFNHDYNTPKPGSQSPGSPE
ncbi:MAG: hypothetical protein WC321_03460 [Candidatus Omnitrophota bacterium]|jgi:hypothetical protein